MPFLASHRRRRNHRRTISRDDSSAWDDRCKGSSRRCDYFRLILYRPIACTLLSRERQIASSHANNKSGARQDKSKSVCFQPERGGGRRRGRGRSERAHLTFRINFALHLQVPPACSRVASAASPNYVISDSSYLAPLSLRFLSEHLFIRINEYFYFKFRANASRTSLSERYYADGHDDATEKSVRSCSFRAR